jgi:predicted enzyme related to lactoylglutathione lyase
MPPSLTNGEICYIEIPATGIQRSADFYVKVFGWRVRRRGDGSTAFDDATGALVDSIFNGRGPPATSPAGIRAHAPRPKRGDQSGRSAIRFRRWDR